MNFVLINHSKNRQNDRRLLESTSTIPIYAFLAFVGMYSFIMIHYYLLWLFIVILFSLLISCRKTKSRHLLSALSERNAFQAEHEALALLYNHLSRDAAARASNAAAGQLRRQWRSRFEVYYFIWCSFMLQNFYWLVSDFDLEMYFFADFPFWIWKDFAWRCFVWRSIVSRKCVVHCDASRRILASSIVVGLWRSMWFIYIFVYLLIIFVILILKKKGFAKMAKRWSRSSYWWSYFARFEWENIATRYGNNRQSWVFFNRKYVLFVFCFVLFFSSSMYTRIEFRMAFGWLFGLHQSNNCCQQKQWAQTIANITIGNLIRLKFISIVVILWVSSVLKVFNHLK